MQRIGTLLALVASVVAAQQPPITNAGLQTASAAGGLEPAIRTAINNRTTPVWIGYAVPVIPGEHNSCCWNDNSRGCGLEGQRVIDAARPAGPVQLEGPTHVAVLLRYEQNTLGKVRTLSIDCSVDAGGLPFFWPTNVKPADSVALLSSHAVRQLEASPRGKGGDSSLHAIALHAGPEAETTLVKFATSTESESIRKSAIFWLANSRGKRGFEIVSRVAREDVSDKVREHAAFALTLSKEPEAIPAIIRMAKEDRSPHVRGQALFWLGQKAAHQSTATLTEAIERDPDTEVKKKAVFALTQLPSNEGVPKLIEVARNNSNPAVRKQAMFWLGQSKDPRAIEFFEAVLRK